MRAIVTVIGKDTVGILSSVSGSCAKHKANVMDVSQTVMQDMFAMIMMIDISSLDIDFLKFSDELKAIGKEMGLEIHVMHEDIFNSMHKI